MYANPAEYATANNLGVSCGVQSKQSELRLVLLHNAEGKPKKERSSQLPSDWCASLGVLTQRINPLLNVNKKVFSQTDGSSVIKAPPLTFHLRPEQGSDSQSFKAASHSAHDFVAGNGLQLASEVRLISTLRLLNP